MEDFNDLTEQYQEFGNLLKEVFTKYDYKIWIAAFFVILSFVFNMFLLHKGYFTFQTRNARRVRKAKELGQVVQARLVKNHTSIHDKLGESCSADYSYTIGGKQYKYHYVDYKYPPQTLTLYYISNPKFVFYEQAATWQPGLLMYILPIVLGIIIMKLLGVEM